MVAKNYNHDMNLQGNEIQNGVFQNVPQNPENPKTGQFWFDTAEDTLKVKTENSGIKDALSQGKVYTQGTGILVNNTNNTISVDNTVALKTEIPTKVSDLTNDSGFITGITSSDVTTALGYTPYNATNPSGYQANVIENIKVNDNALTPTNKTVNIVIPTSASDIGALPNTTTIEDLTTSSQLAAINSGATTTNIGQIATNTSAISTINGKIPSAASSTNQLADKNFVNSSIATNTATFRGTFDSVAELEAYSGEKDDNDYAFVTEADSDGNTYYDKYKYNGTTWVFEYRLNNSSFTSAQWATINSGANSTNIGQIATNTSDIADLTTNKQDVISDLSTIRSNASAGANAATTIGGYGNIVTHNVNEFATAVQGQKADTALQEVTESDVTVALGYTPARVLAVNNPALTVTSGSWTWSITNSIGDADVIVQVRNISTNAVEDFVIKPTANTITIQGNASANIAADTYRAVIIG